MSGFSVAWLDLREAADHRSRSKALLEEVRVWLERRSGARIVDLGSGTGSTLRAFEHAQVAQPEWRFVDHDAQLLAEAARRHRQHLVLDTTVADLRDVAALPIDDATLVSASALFDLVSAEFCDALCERLAQGKLALYAALNYDGHMQWTPPHPLDVTVLEAFNRDQRRDKGLGLALGPDATDYLKRLLEAKGYMVSVASSPWLLNGADGALVAELCRGCAAALADTLDLMALADWLRFRLAHAYTGTCEIGHLDLWAEPN